MESGASEAEPPSEALAHRQIRAVHDAEHVTVFQAFSAAIADNALEAGRLVPPFKRGRATWIKPSFLWMMYRSGWATKPEQERVLAIHITRRGFDWALENAVLTTFEPLVHGTREVWARQSETCPVRVQWDPDRSVDLHRLPQRDIQIGLTGDAVNRYLDEWLVAIDDVTALAQQLRHLVAEGRMAAAVQILPHEEAYPVRARVSERLGMMLPEAA